MNLQDGGIQDPHCSLSCGTDAPLYGADRDADASHGEGAKTASYLMNASGTAAAESSSSSSAVALAGETGA
jgi:hypothetical protein